jgi:transposase-like protein
MVTNETGSLTKDAITKYNNSPYHCPYCESSDICANDFNEETGRQKVLCNNCKESWNDIFKFSGIEEVQ